MRLFAVKSDKTELYFQLEKTNEGIKILNKVAHILYGDTEFFFDMVWQEGLPKKESYESHESKGVYIGVIVSRDRIHLLIRELKDKQKLDKIKDIIFEKYAFKKSLK